MQRSSSPPDAGKRLICDASFWINLVATQSAEPLIGAWGHPLSLTTVAYTELKSGELTGRTAGAAVTDLVARGLVHVVEHSPEDDELYLSLIVGAASETLDDGEASTIVCAIRQGGIAIIDERKAISLAATRFPTLPVLSTTDLLLDGRVADALGEASMIDALFGALSDARMRVPPHKLTEVVALIGAERAKLCSCLPLRLRKSLSPVTTGREDEDAPVGQGMVTGRANG